MSNPFYTVYLLIDPRNGDIRYVGCTKYPVKVRLSQHLSCKARPDKFNWICDLKQNGLRPVGHTLLEIPDCVEAFYQEQVWIKRLYLAGCPLFNGAPQIRTPMPDLTLWPPVKLPGLPQWCMRKNRVLWRVTS